MQFTLARPRVPSHSGIMASEEPSLPRATYSAAGRGDLVAVRAWLRGGGNVDAGIHGITMLMAASAAPCDAIADRRSADAMVAALLQHGASVDLQSDGGRTALMLASAQGNKTTVAALLGHGATVNLQSDHGTALTVASSAGNEAMVAMLLERSASVDLQSKKGHTALMCASRQDHLAVVRQLLAAGTDPMQCDEDGDTAADWAASEGHATVVEILRSHARDSSAPAAAAASSAPAASSSSPTQPLPDVVRLAARQGQLATVEAWLRGGGQVDAQSEGWWRSSSPSEVASGRLRGAGRTLLMMASSDGEEALLAALLARGASVDQQDSEGGTALQFASLECHTAVVAALLERGASVDLQDNDGGTALMFASQENSPTVVRQLLAAGADPSLCDEDGDTAADWARATQALLPPPTTVLRGRCSVVSWTSPSALR